MPKSSRLQGLELLRSLGAPTPDLQIVKSTKDLKALKFRSVDCGWTIRTCRLDGGPEMNLFYANYLTKSDTLKRLRYRLKRYVGKEFYIVYPSWKFQFSFNILWDGANYIFEGVYGSQVGISRGSSKPTFGFTVPFGRLIDIRMFSGTLDEKIRTWLRRIIYWCDKLATQDDFYCLEGAVQAPPKLIFYDLRFGKDVQNSIKSS